MAKSNYIQRAQDSLDLLLIADTHLANIKRACKAAVAYSFAQRMERFKQAKITLENELKRLSANVVGGLFAKLKKCSLISKLKAQISDVNRQIVEWINITYRHVFASNS